MATTKQLKALETAYETAAASFTDANKTYNRALAAVDGDATQLSAEERVAFIDARTAVDDAYAQLVAAQIEALADSQPED